MCPEWDHVYHISLCGLIPCTFEIHILLCLIRFRKRKPHRIMRGAISHWSTVVVLEIRPQSYLSFRFLSEAFSLSQPRSHCHPGSRWLRSNHLSAFYPHQPLLSGLLELQEQGTSASRILFWRLLPVPSLPSLRSGSALFSEKYVSTLIRSAPISVLALRCETSPFFTPRVFVYSFSKQAAHWRFS